MKNIKTFKNFVAGFILGISLLAFGAYAAGTSGGTIGSLFGYNTTTGKYYLKGENIEDNSITSDKIKDGSITTDDFNSSVMNEITTSKIYDKDDTSYYLNPNNYSRINYVSADTLYLTNDVTDSCEGNGYLTTNSFGKVYCKTNNSSSLEITDGLECNTGENTIKYSTRLSKIYTCIDGELQQSIDSSTKEMRVSNCMAYECSGSKRQLNQWSILYVYGEDEFMDYNNSPTYVSEPTVDCNKDTDGSDGWYLRETNGDMAVGNTDEHSNTTSGIYIDDFKDYLLYGNVKRKGDYDGSGGNEDGSYFPVVSDTDGRDSASIGVCETFLYDGTNF